MQNHILQALNFLFHIPGNNSAIEALQREQQNNYYEHRLIR